jgi:hypothetical protein
VEALVQLSSSSSQDPAVRGHVAFALTHICSGDSEDIKQRAAGAGAVEALVQLSSSSSQDTGMMGQHDGSGHRHDGQCSAGAVEHLQQ